MPILLEHHEGLFERENVRLSVDLPAEAHVEVNHMFVEALGELVVNAVVHNERETPRVAVTVERDDDRGAVEVRVADDGPGFPEHVTELLGRAEENQLDHLDGMGLWFVYWIVAESNGELLIADSELGGSCVRVPVRVPMPNRRVR